MKLNLGKLRRSKPHKKSIFRKTAIIFVIVAMVPTAIIGIQHRRSYNHNLRDMVAAGTISREDAARLQNGSETQDLAYAGYSLLIALVLGYFFASSLVRPIRVLQQGSRKIGGGDLKHRVETDTEDELEDLAVSINQMAASLESREQELTLRSRDLAILYEIAHTMAESRDLSTLLDQALEKAMEITGCESGCILLDEHGVLQPVICRTSEHGKGPAGPHTRIFKDAAHAATDSGKVALYDISEYAGLSFDSIACVPMKFEGSLRGAVCVTGNKADFSQNTLDLLAALGSEVAVAIESTRLFLKLEDQNRELALATSEIANLISEAEKKKSFGIRYQNPNLVKCWEFKDCDQRSCPAFGSLENQRCWQVAGTHCGGEVQGVFAQKLGRCEKCEVFTAACPDKITMMGETFNNMMAVLEQRVDEKEELQRQLFSSSKLAAIGELAAGVAHEINNPLTGILGSAVLMKSHPQDAATFQKRLAIIESEALRARDIVRNLLDFSRQGNLKRSPASIEQLLEHTLFLMHHQADMSSVRINTSFDSGLPELVIDGNQMKQVFINIIHNAIQSMPQGGQLDISSGLRVGGAGEGLVEVAFTDTGVGMDEHAAARIFDPFFTTKRVGEGTGLGLSVSQRIVDEHGGTITVASEPGKGSVFTITLPVPGAEAQQDRFVA